MKRTAPAIAAAVLCLLFSISARADKLDDIIASGKLRCAVALDFPPMGSRDHKRAGDGARLHAPSPEVTGGSMTKFQPRQVRCVKRPENMPAK